MPKLLALYECLACYATFEWKLPWQIPLKQCIRCHKKAARVLRADPASYATFRHAVRRYHVINALAASIDARTYLEIGLGPTHDSYGTYVRNFTEVKIPEKESVDPFQTDATHVMTSDTFFQRNNRKFDIIFVDGLHHEDQVLRDVSNALAAITPKGAVVVHDCNPETEEAQLVPPIPGVVVWNGDVWKAWVSLRQTRPDLDMCVVDIDHGTGVVRFGAQELLAPTPALDYAWLEKNRAALNLIPFPEWTGEIAHR